MIIILRAIFKYLKIQDKDLQFLFNKNNGNNFKLKSKVQSYIVTVI